jgi:galactose-1-phosphate uridylyltransferase
MNMIYNLCPLENGLSGYHILVICIDPEHNKYLAVDMINASATYGYDENEAIVNLLMLSGTKEELTFTLKQS